MSFHAIVHSVIDAGEKAENEALNAGKTPNEAKEAKRLAEADSWNVAGSCGIRPLSYALTSAAIGSVVPVIGTGLGAFLGYVVGTISAVRNPNMGQDLASTTRKLLQ
jgi:hypothetical protein